MTQLEIYENITAYQFFSIRNVQTTTPIQ